MLEGENIFLRPIKKEDVKLLLKWFNDPEITQYLTSNHHLPYTQEAGEEWVKKVNSFQKDIMLLIEIKEPEKENIPVGIAGIVGINWKDKSANGFLVIGETEYWENGHGAEVSDLFLTYCFETLNLRRISTYVLDFNERSIGLHKKLGFVEEGLQREAVFKKGRYCDQIFLGLLKSDWAEARRKK